MPVKLFEKVLKQYNSNQIYKTVIDELICLIKSNIDIEQIDYISGGERRDWFFSNIIAYLLNKPHISIYKDSSIVIHNNTFSNIINNSKAQNAKVLHIADLITEASSYSKIWIPAIENLGANILWSCVVVDRMQGGKEKLESYNIKSLSMINIDEQLFKIALDKNIINTTQYEMLINFYRNPDNTMRDFLLKHPNFLKEALNSDEKTALRAKLCIDNNLYNI